MWWREVLACVVNVLQGRGLFCPLKRVDDIVLWGPISRRPESHSNQRLEISKSKQQWMMEAIWTKWKFYSNKNAFIIYFLWNNRRTESKHYMKKWKPENTMHSSMKHCNKNFTKTPWGNNTSSKIVLCTELYGSPYMQKNKKEKSHWPRVLTFNWLTSDFPIDPSIFLLNVPKLKSI